MRSTLFSSGCMGDTQFHFRIRQSPGRRHFPKSAIQKDYPHQLQVWCHNWTVSVFHYCGKKNYKNKNSIGMHVYNWIERFKCLPYVYMQIIIKSNLSSSIILSKKHIVYSIKYNWRKKWWKYNLVWNIYSSQWSEGKKISCLLTLKPGMYICSC